MLTGLLNRVEMEARISAQIDENNGFSLVFLHLCNLPVVLRQFGLAIRSDVVSAFAKRMCAFLAQGPVVGRWSDDRFMVLLAHNKAEAIRLAKRLVEHVSGTYVCMERQAAAPVAGGQYGGGGPRGGGKSRVADGAMQAFVKEPGASGTV